MKLAFIINNFRDKNFKSGGEKLFYELIHKAFLNNHDVHLFCTIYNSNEEYKFFKGKIPIKYLNAHSKDFKKPEKIQKLFNELYNDIEKEGFDYIISENITPYNDIAVIQGHSAFKYSQIIKNPISKLIFLIKKSSVLKYQKKWLSQSYKKIIVPSITLKNELIENFKISESSIEVIYPGVDIPENLSFYDVNDLAARKRPVIFGISATNFTYKGGFILLKALYLLKKQDQPFKIRLINNKYHKKINNLKILYYMTRYSLWNDIEFIPQQNDMSKFYESIDCLLMPSLIETFGLVSIEAMSYKRPCIVSSVSGVSELIDDRINGFVFILDKNAATNLAEKMAYLINHISQIEEVSKNAFNLAKSHSWNDFYKKFFNSLCDS